MPALLSSNMPTVDSERREKNLLMTDSTNPLSRSMGKPGPVNLAQNKITQDKPDIVTSSLSKANTESSSNAVNRMNSKESDENEQIGTVITGRNVDNTNSPNSSSDLGSDDLSRYDEDLENIYDEQFQGNIDCEDGTQISSHDIELENDELDEDEDFCIMDTGSEDEQFDNIVGQLEDIAVSKDFQDLMLGFCQKHCDIFEDSEENKLEYTEIFNTWTGYIESFIEERLKQTVEDFSTASFLQQLCERQNIEQEIVEDVLELLVSLSDFETFKQLMLNHKAARPEQRQTTIKGGMQELSLSGKASKIHA